MQAIGTTKGPCHNPRVARFNFQTAGCGTGHLPIMLNLTQLGNILHQPCEFLLHWSRLHILDLIRNSVEFSV
eukprot:4920600-Amphidinium_carterae.1